ncbi:alpha/beta-hydrolase [Aspergillus egyptiacus]|nr:alpha/beta-hydrolase [Aspergillus egyptiacus]
MIRDPALSFSLAILGITVTVTADPTVTIASGVIVGTAVTPSNQPTATGVINAFLGIPFAKSPPERFSPPEEPEPWSTPLLAQALPPSCPEQALPGGLSLEASLTSPVAGNTQQSEDCLYLNIYAPQNASASNLKEVMFWIHGGNLVSGSASQSLYWGSPLPINEDIILVTTNYRLSFFGFSNSPGIPYGEQNSGFLDQRLALDWARQNIQHFGGDPTKITVFGESAGGLSVKQLIATPPSPLPFRAAIIESEAMELPRNGTANYQNVSQYFNCTDIQCLRNVSATSIQDYISNNHLFFKPVDDGVSYVSDIRNSITNGSSANIPILIGSNRNELSELVFSISLGGTLNVDQTLDVICEVLRIPQQTCSYLILFTCPIGAIANYTNGQSYKVWRYRYSASLNDSQTFPGEGATHASEVPIVFGTYQTRNATGQEVSLSRYMQHAWASFAKSPDVGPGWPRLGTNQGTELADIGSGNSSGENSITFWETDIYCGTLLVFAEYLGFAW